MIMPSPMGIRTLMSSDAIPLVRGSYRPRHISIEEELRPGTIRLSPQKNPQKRKLRNDGGITIPT